MPQIRHEEGWASPVLRSFNGPEPGGPESMIRKQKREANIPWVMQRTNKTQGQGLYHSHRHRASSRRGLESPGRNGRLPCSRELARG